MTDVLDWRCAAVDGVPFDRWGFVLTGQDLPRAVPLTELRELPGGGFVDLTWRDEAGYPALAPVQAVLTLRHLDADPDAVAADTSRLFAAVHGRMVAYRPWNRPDVEYRGVARASVVEDGGRWARVSVEMSCEPEAYGAARQAAVRSGSTSLHVGGDRPARPTFRLTAASAGQVSVTDSATGAYVRTRDSVAAGAAVVVDMANKTVEVDGVPAAVTAPSRFFTLPPGNASVLTSNASGYASWRERWS